MRRLFVRTLHVLAWLCLITALPGIWLAGFCRGLAVALEDRGPGATGDRWAGHAILTDHDTATLLGAHERAMRRGEARWQ